MLGLRTLKQEKPIVQFNVRSRLLVHSCRFAADLDARNQLGFEVAAARKALMRTDSRRRRRAARTRSWSTRALSAHHSL